MELDQILFKKIFRIYEKWKFKNSRDESFKTVNLVDISPRLTLIARALTGRSIDIMPAEKEGGWKNNVFYLPSSISLMPTLEENLNYYIYRIVYLSIQSSKNLNWNQKNQPENIEVFRNKGKEYAPLVLEKMKEDYPPVLNFYHTSRNYFEDCKIPLFWLYGKCMVNQDVMENENLKHANNNVLEKNTVNPSTEIKSKPVEEVEILQVDTKAQEDFMLTHNFEKVETAEEFSGVWRGFDGDDNLQEEADALNELNLKHLVRTPEVAHSLYQAEFRDLANIQESAETNEEGIFLTYEEWDFAKKRYKPDFCKVYLKKINTGDTEYAQKCLAEKFKNPKCPPTKICPDQSKKKIGQQAARW